MFDQVNLYKISFFHQLLVNQQFELYHLIMIVQLVQAIDVIYVENRLNSLVMMIDFHYLSNDQFDLNEK
jgi:hypothetical protein